MFIAADPPRSLLESLAAETEGLKAELPGARWMPIEHQHVTIRFLGYVDEERIHELDAVVGDFAAGLAPGTAAISGLGAFPSARRAKVLWAGLLDETGTLGIAEEAISGRLETMGYERETRAYAPHLTLARMKEPTTLTDLLDAEIGHRPFAVDEVVLYRSHTSSAGARYEPLRRYPLTG